ncbi:PDZ domain-containing protein [Streptomyces deserti]
MEHTALRPKPMPGQDPGATAGTASEPARRCPHAARRLGRRLMGVLLVVLAALVLLLSGIGLGTVGATVIGMTRLTDLPRHSAQPVGPSPSARPSPSPSTPPPAPVRASLGLEVADAGKPGALVVGVHIPGPGFAAGLVRGDVLLAFGTTRIDSAADLVRAVAAARPGTAVKLTVRHRSGGYQQLTVVPGVVT